MKAITFHSAKDTFQLEEIQMPTPAKDEVRIKVQACGINPVDAKVIQWKGMVGERMNDEWVVGLDVVGVIDEIGEEVEGWNVGDEVFYHGNMTRPHGGLAEYAIHKVNTLLDKPKELPLLDAAASPCAGWTAWRAIVEKLKVNEDDSLLIIGGSGGVGSYAVQIAKNVCGCKEILAVASSRNEEYVKSLGADHVICYDKVNVLEEVQRLTNGEGVTKSFDTIGDDNDILAANALGFNGQMLELVRTVRPDQYENVFMKNLTFHQLALGAGHEHGNIGQKAIVDAGIGLTVALVNGKVKSPKLVTVDFEGAITTLNNILNKKVVGKVVLTL
ncbi:zinc-binding dehydrogenase [Flammeovirga sp. EKP202]|uniref:zinc-binding dehydrogenase n=1 Tax=Flammeovirga sp. EKP202 TaxID=2770592 RepID=UPI00165F943A|nr:zinc-binding dehydrogenase [Flammeovirga sp. EKP202]MBD0401801.1 zinc-binding dehydrogenase [Flammeovirga sp. EKP202]